MYLKSCFLGSILDFNKIVKREGSRVLLDNGEYVSYRKSEYFQQVPGWERITYELFDKKEDCIKYIQDNYEKLKEFNCEQNLNKLLNQKCFKED